MTISRISSSTSHQRVLKLSSSTTWSCSCSLTESSRMTPSSTWMTPSSNLQLCATPCTCTVKTLKVHSSCAHPSPLSSYGTLNLQKLSNSHIESLVKIPTQCTTWTWLKRLRTLATKRTSISDKPYPPAGRKTPHRNQIGLNSQKHCMKQTFSRSISLTFPQKRWC